MSKLAHMFLRTSMLTCLATSLLAAPAASAGTCHHAFRATDGTEIYVDYQYAFHGVGDGMPGFYVLDPFTVTVAGPHINENAPIRAVLVDVQTDHSGPQPIREPSSTNFDLHAAVSNKASATGVIYQSGDGRPELAVVVDGRWLVDPISDTSNFKFQLAGGRQNCARYDR